MKRLILFSCTIGTILCYKWDLNADLRNCKPDCDSKIFCRGEILHEVQTNRLWDDQTTFVEKRLLFPEAQIIQKYEKLKQQSRGKKITKSQLRKFVDENFANDSLPACNFDDYTKTPSILKATTKQKYKSWLTWLNNRWLEMGGELDPSVKKNPELHSYLYVPNRFVKAGGRFTGTYYWDSYWIVKGLLLSDMKTTARGMIENIIYLVEQMGHMPNGNRNYYSQRSQPPLLIQMAGEYLALTRNTSFIRKNLNAFRKEFQFWDENRAVEVQKGRNVYRMYRYKTLSCDPRPESYYEDYTLVQNITDPGKRMQIFTGIRSAAETGWDFSSRHMRGDTATNGSLRRMDTMDMVYVDLNSIIHANLKLLASWEKAYGSQKNALAYQDKANKLLAAIEAVLWNNEEGSWFDYDLITEKCRKYFYVSNLTPLWSGSYTSTHQVECVIRYLKREGMINENLTSRHYCLPTSTDNSTQQWDYPNCWAPLQAFAIHGLHSADNAQAKQIAFNLAQAWIRTTYEGWRNTTEMYEKYDALVLGGSGGGGEYTPQTGFGWTNGLCMDFFNTWRDQLQ